jgi:hypothetical protein
MVIMIKIKILGYIISYLSRARGAQVDSQREKRNHLISLANGLTTLGYRGIRSGSGQERVLLTGGPVSEVGGLVPLEEEHSGTRSSEWWMGALLGRREELWALVFVRISVYVVDESIWGEYGRRRCYVDWLCVG